MLIQRIDTPAPEVRAAIIEVIDGYNDGVTGRPESAKPFAALLRDEAGAVTGGLWAVTYYDWMHVDLFYLPAHARRGGLGRRMMRAAEREATRRGCTGIWLDTMSFQAPAFYRELGFKVFGGIQRYRDTHTRFWLLKRAPFADAGDVDGIETSDTPEPSARAAILAGLQAYNDSHVGPAERLEFCLAVRDRADGPIRGGLFASVARGWMFVELLVLPESARGQGLGTTLMREAESIARGHGAHGAFLDTFSFQARPFYERLGYRVYGEIPDFPAPHRRHLLARGLDGGALVTEAAAP
jgi:GNAT superfamily N-acetyltransferase